MLELKLGMAGLRDHRVRTFLTTLGVVFGVAAVIAMLSISEGAKREALAQFESLGIDNVVVMHQDPPDVSDAEEATTRSRRLAVADAQALADLTPAIVCAVPQSVRELHVRGKNRIKANVVGTTADLVAVRRDVISQGRFFNDDEQATARRVCVLGSGLVRDLCGLDDPVGSFVRIENDWYEVIGVLVSGGPVDNDEDGLLRSTDNDVYIPLSCALLRGERKRWDRELDRIILQVADLGQLTDVARLTERVLERRHHGEPDTRVVIPLDLIRQRQETQRIFSLVMGAIAGISLLVGGIGIMNIMLASILERTREIGVRLAMGATRTNIMRQFLIEAATVSFAGGIMGIIVGVSLAWIISAAAGWTTVVSLLSIVLAFGVSALVGIAFGYFPARRAAALNPIECLRYE